MKIQKFHESYNNDLFKIKNYFSNFYDDMEDICTINISEVNKTLYNISIERKTLQEINENNLNEIESWIISNQEDNNILKEIRAALIMISQDDMLESFKLKKTLNGFKIEVNTQIIGEIEDWIYVEVPDIKWDKKRLIKIINQKFGVTPVMASIVSTFNRDEDRVLELQIQIDENDITIVEKIKKYILSLTYDDYGSQTEIFVRSDIYDLNRHDQTGFLISFESDDQIYEIEGEMS
jgi:hypothetical protein